MARLKLLETYKLPFANLVLQPPYAKLNFLVPFAKSDVVNIAYEGKAL